MRARWLFSLAILALPLLQGGCSTIAAVQNISGDRVVTDSIKQVTHAYRNASGDIIVCLKGWPGGTDEKPPMQAFSIVFPAGAFSSNEQKAPHLNKAYRLPRLPTFDVETKSVKGPCPASGSDESKSLASIPVETVHDTDFGLSYFKGERKESFKRYFNARPMTPTVYQLLSDTECDADDRLRIIYVHDSPIFNGERIVQVETSSRTIKTGKNYAYLVLLPVTLAVDLVALVGIFPMYLVTVAIADKGYVVMPNWTIFAPDCMEEEPAG